MIESFDHVTVVVRDVEAAKHFLLKYRSPEPTPDPTIGQLSTLGFNHVCFAVDDLDAELARHAPPPAGPAPARSPN